MIPSIALTAAEKAVRTVGGYLKDRYHAGHAVSIVNAHETIADDREAENRILDILEKSVGEFSYVSEETQQRNASEIEFIIDPIDGTSNYLRSIPFFATQIAVVYRGELVAGFVYEPVRENLYHAVAGSGFFVNGQRVALTTGKPLAEITLCAASGSRTERKSYLFRKISEKLIPHIRSVRLYGSTGLELAYIAAGKLDAHINYQSQVYDYAPGAILVREAGGSVLTYSGDDWTLQQDTLIAAHSCLAKDLCRCLNQD